MTNYYKYLPVSREDENWWLCVLNAGCNRISKSAVYPSPDHPTHHYFNWNKGRVLDEYQLIYIARGEGIFESGNCKQQVVGEGTVILLFPGEWHRFKPNEATGWDEMWVGFKGTIANNLVKKSFFGAKNPLLEIGVNDIVAGLVSGIIENAKQEKPGYQPLIGGTVLHLLGYLHSLTRQQNFKQEDNTTSIINRARVILRNSLEQNIAIEQVAEELQVSYSFFRKAFKAYTGIAPGQYLLQLKIERAKLLLPDASRSVKQIAYELNFESAFYFSAIFKKKTGISPQKYRKQNGV